jgi:tRNA dimethylallyltransferase
MNIDNKVKTGYREFNEYLSESTEQTTKTFANAIERMKISTRQYAKRQITWIRNKLLPAIYTANAQAGEEVASAYLLDATGQLSHYTFSGG